MARLFLAHDIARAADIEVLEAMVKPAPRLSSEPRTRSRFSAAGVSFTRGFVVR
jgi:hypothetical protein